MAGLPTLEGSTQHANQPDPQTGASGQESIQHDLETLAAHADPGGGGYVSSEGNGDDNGVSDDPIEICGVREILLDDEGT